jgi:hypothetical protein
MSRLSIGLQNKRLRVHGSSAQSASGAVGTCTCQSLFVGFVYASITSANINAGVCRVSHARSFYVSASKPIRARSHGCRGLVA